MITRMTITDNNHVHIIHDNSQFVHTYYKRERSSHLYTICCNDSNRILHISLSWRCRF